ncbi:phage tail length tape measure family protein [Mycoplana ramosa]|uniref:Phage tail length tape measure family protein n=1 Tax=Mycoplana ramosa TaxID=40837 RepID=A0ABW3Z218_MYCRA
MAPPLKIAARIEIDGSQAQAGAAGARQAIETVGTAAAGAETKLQRLIAASTGLHSGPANENLRRWNGLLADEAMSLDRLRAKYNPLFAVIQNYKAAQVEIRTAHAMGALSADEMTAALSRQRQATLASIDAIKGRNRAIETTPRIGGAGVGSFHTANIAAQFQDIAVTSAMGMSPLQIALQQGTQLSMVFEQLKAGGQSAGAALAAAFTSIISPMSLLTIGAVAAGAAVIQYFSSVKSGTRTVDDILARHAENIEALGPAYKKALKEQRNYAELSPSIIGARLGDDAKDASKKAIEEARRALQAIEIASNSTRSTIGVVPNFGGLEQLAPQFEAARNAIQDYAASVEAGAPKVQVFQEQIIRLRDAGQISAEAASELRKMTDAALEAETSLAGVSGTIDPILQAFNELQKGIDKVNPFAASGRLGELESELQDLWRNMRSGQLTVTDLNRKIVALSSANPDMSSAIEEIGRLGLAALQAMQNVQALDGAVRTTSKTGRLRAEDQNQKDLNFFLRTDNDLKTDLESQAEELKRARDKALRSGQSERNAYRDLIKTADDRVQQMKLEAELAGVTGVAADTLRFKLDLLQQSEDKGRSLTQKQVEAINARVEAFRRYAEEAAKATLKADLLFEREQLGRSAFDQQIAAGLRSSGLPVDFDSYEAGLIRTNLQLEYARDLVGDVGGTLASSLRQGKNLWESLGDAGVSALTRIADTLLNDVLNSLFQVQGAGGSGGGILGSIFGGIFGGGSSFFPAAPKLGVMDAFSAGGYTGPGGMFEPAGVVHRGEVVWSQRDVSRAGGVATVEAMRLGLRGYERGGVVGVKPLMPAGRADAAAGSAGGQMTLLVRLGMEADDAGNIRALIKSVVAEDAPGYAVRVVEEYDTRLPDRVASINDRPRWR